MWGDRSTEDNCSSTFEKSTLEDENEDLTRALDFSSQDLIDEDDQLALALEESIQISRKSRGKGHKWWKVFKNIKHPGETSRGKSLKTSNNSTQQKFVVCDICEEQIISTQCFITYWGQTSCEKHDFDGTPICSSCLRFKMKNVRYVTLNDDRKLCPDCCSTAILDHESCTTLVHEMHTFYGGLNMQIRRDIPVFLVDEFEMTKLASPPSPTGLTIYDNLDKVNCVKWSTIKDGENNIEVVKQVHYIIPNHHCQVNSILLLYGFPKLVIGATLAHEMMHAWMRIEGYHSLEKKIEEGICEVMAHKWLEWYGFIGEDMDDAHEEAQFLRNLKEYDKNRIEVNYCKTYGDGFRDAKWAIERYGLRYTLKCVANTGKFPK